MFREEGSGTQRHDHCGFLSVGKRKHLDNFFVQLEKSLKLKCVEFIEKASQCCSWVTTSQNSKDKITLKSKDAYVDNMLTMLGMSCKPTNTPLVRKESVANDDQEMLEGSDTETYRSVVGILMYFKRHRFDLHYAAKSLAMASSSPTKGHMRRLKRVVRHMQGTRDMHLELVRPREQLTELVGWCDGSWADLDEQRSSTAGGLLMLGGACVAGWSRTQKPTALSSGESEFFSATACACELLWACAFLREVGYTMTACLKEDASACIGMATRLGLGRLKHVEIKHFALQHWIRQGRLNLDRVIATEQLADIMTKPNSFQTLSTLVPRISFTKCVTDHLNLRIRANGLAMLARLSHQFQ